MPWKSCSQNSKALETLCEPLPGKRLVVYDMFTRWMWLCGSRKERAASHRCVSKVSHWTREGSRTEDTLLISHRRPGRGKTKAATEAGKWLSVESEGVGTDWKGQSACWKPSVFGLQRWHRSGLVD